MSRTPWVAVPFPVRCGSCNALVWYVAEQQSWCDRVPENRGRGTGAMVYTRHVCPDDEPMTDEQIAWVRAQRR